MRVTNAKNNASISLLLPIMPTIPRGNPCAFETKPRNTGNAGRAGRACSALALADAVVTRVVLVDDFVVDLALGILVDVFVDDDDTILDVVLVDAVVDDFVLVRLVDVFVDDAAVVMLVDAVVDRVQLEVGVLESTQHMLLAPLFCKEFCT